jgi:HD-GYP domain-containing protein (c-di-GMP phosphodiesterase class II)
MSALPYLTPYLFSLAITLGVAAFSWRRHSVIGATRYGWVAFSQSLWTMGYILELAGTSLEQKHFWDDFQWVGGILGMLTFAAFTLEYVRTKIEYPRLAWALIGAFPAAYTLFLVFPPLHHLVHGQQWITPGVPFSILEYELTPVTMAFGVYGIALNLFFVGVLIHRFTRAHNLYRWQTFTIAIGAIIPLIGWALLLAGVKLSAQRDISPIAFAAGNLVVAWGLFRYGLFDIVPIARDTVIENMADLVIVLDAQDRIVDINPVALNAIEKKAAQVVGKFAADVYAEWPELLRDFTKPSNKIIKTTFHAYGKTYHHEVKATILHDRNRRYIGRVFVSRDITLHVELQKNLERLNEELERRVRERTEALEEAYDTTLEGWAKALELRDKETEGHSWRVTEMTIKLALALDVPYDEFDHIRRGAILHDIGKMAIPDEILRKTGPLNEAERDIVLQHPAIAHQLLARIPFLKKALDIPYCHHEKWDGSGYPRGLRGEEIPLAARIFAVADVWDAIQSERPYKKAWSREEAIAYLREQAGSHFDPAVMEVFLSLVENDKI